MGPVPIIVYKKAANISYISSFLNIWGQSLIGLGIGVLHFAQKLLKKSVLPIDRHF